MIHSKRIAITLLFVLNVHNILASDENSTYITRKSECKDVDIVTPIVPFSKDKDKFLFYKNYAKTRVPYHMKNTYCDLNLDSEQEKTRIEFIGKQGSYKNLFCTTVQQLIENNVITVRNTIDKNITDCLLTFSPYMHVFPVALEMCMQNRTILEKRKLNKEQLQKEVASLESGPNIPKTDLSLFDYVAYQMMKSDISKLTKK